MRGLFYVRKSVSYVEGDTTYVAIYLFFPNICNNKSVREVEVVKIHLELDPSQDEIEIIVKTKEVTDEVQHLLKRIEGGGVKQIVGISEQQYYLLEPKDIYWFYAEGRKIMAQTTKGSLEVKSRLYELETKLQGDRFVRFSKSTLANLQYVTSFEMSFSGSMCAHFSNGMKEYVSRKYVPLIKEALNIGGG